MFCPNCGSKLEKNVRFCGECGEKMPIPPPHGIQLKYRRVETTQESVHNTDPATEINVDSNKSEAVKEKKTKSRTNKKFVPIIAVGSVLVAAFVALLGIHTCEECDEVYFGAQNEISFFGETEKVCRECYDDFYDFSSWF